MTHDNEQLGLRSSVTRRRFMLSTSMLPFATWAAGLGGGVTATSGISGGTEVAPPKVTDVLNVRDFEPLARSALPPAHFGYLATGIDDDRTLRRNEEAFGDYEIRARRFVDLSRVDTGTTLFGTHWRTPVYFSAVSAMRAFHPDGEAAVARAAASRSTQLMVSTGASVPLEQILAQRGAPVWQQLYPTDDWTVTQGLVRRAESAGADAIVLSVDSTATAGVRNSETLRRAARLDKRECTACHVGNRHDMWLRAPLFAGIDVSQVKGLAPPGLTLEWVDRLRGLVRGKLLIKGIVTAEDAQAAVAHGADGIIVSNHGGRNEETLRATIDCIAEVVTAVKGRVPVLWMAAYDEAPTCSRHWRWALLALVSGDLRVGALPPSDRKEPRLYLISMPANWRRSCVRPVRRLLLRSEHALSCIGAEHES
jgi:isopentenyl diphosphate isomerase/L-lactate dehydrogenase-like FMN-dependent dehydrogenase